MDGKAPQGTVAARVLVIADWAVDPHEVTAACCRRATEGQTAFAFVVPAWLLDLRSARQPSQQQSPGGVLLCRSA